MYDLPIRPKNESEDFSVINTCYNTQLTATHAASEPAGDDEMQLGQPNDTSVQPGYGQVFVERPENLLITVFYGSLAVLQAHMNMHDAIDDGQVDTVTEPITYIDVGKVSFGGTSIVTDSLESDVSAPTSADALLDTLNKLNLSALSAQAKAEWKDIGKQIARVLPREFNGRIRISNRDGIMEDVLDKLAELRDGARSEDEKQVQTLPSLPFV
jgi:hypothetical protein